jgi:FkbM family methyltransferase
LTAISYRASLFEIISYPFAAFFRRANRINVRLLAKADPICEVRTWNGGLKFHCPNLLALWRAETLQTKEPDTIDWIHSFGSDALLYDVGANVGLYSLYAARAGARVIAFEPEAQNYALLNRNIHINGLQDKMTALNIAAGDRTRISHLYLSRFEAAGALHNFDRPVDYNQQPFAPAFKQGVMGARLDDLIDHFELPRPTHLKIDVDGAERAVIDGATKLLHDPGLRSVLIELNEMLEADREIVAILEGCGFRVRSKLRSPLLSESTFPGVYNYVFDKA